MAGNTSYSGIPLEIRPLSFTTSARVVGHFRTSEKKVRRERDLGMGKMEKQGTAKRRKSVLQLFISLVTSVGTLSMVVMVSPRAQGTPGA